METQRDSPDLSAYFLALHKPAAGSTWTVVKAHRHSVLVAFTFINSEDENRWAVYDFKPSPFAQQPADGSFTSVFKSFTTEVIAREWFLARADGTGQWPLEQKIAAITDPGVAGAVGQGLKQLRGIVGGGGVAGICEAIQATNKLYLFERISLT